ncbi:substrate-binding domain-containing protein [Streptomyces sp. NPDC101171]|uniref:substrate-binding domain-containing protein n=1 Tax=Streptomyces sp. NPDC101171 TaxID=3366122 RepID=UPI00380464DD
MILMDAELEDERLPLLRGSHQPSVLIGLPADAGGADLRRPGLDGDRRPVRGASGRTRAPRRRRRRRGPGRVRAAHRLRRARPRRPALRGPAGRRPGAPPALRGRVRRDGRAPGPDPGRAARATGFVVQNESAVEPLLALLRRQGRAVPEDVSVVAICPDQVAVRASVRMTSVAIPAQEMGRHAVEHLTAKLDGRDGDEVVLIAPELTVRASTGPAPAAS